MPNQKLTLEVKDKHRAIIVLRPAEYILDLAGTYIPKKVVSVLRLRRLMEKNMKDSKMYFKV